MFDAKTAPYAVLALRVTTGALRYLTMLVEIAGGVALILGVRTPIVSAALVPVLLGAEARAAADA